MSTLKRNHDPAFSVTLRNVYSLFQQQYLGEQCVNEECLEQDGVRFLGAWIGLKPTFNARHLRRSIGALLDLEHFRMIQVVGDSGSQFSSAGIEKTKSILQSLVDDNTDIGRTKVLEYGYTASKNDSNWIVNDLIATIPGLGARTIANVVHMSATAVEDWGCEATSFVRNFVLAYDKNETAFGSDTWLSDSVMDGGSGDVMVCLEGGPQAFSQTVSVCLEGVPVIGITGSKMRLRPSASDMPRFSAANLLHLLLEKYQDCVDQDHVTDDEKTVMEITTMEYLNSCRDLQSDGSCSKYEVIQTSLKALLKKVECLKTIRIEDVL